MRSTSSKIEPSERYALLGHNALSLTEDTDGEVRLFKVIEGLLSLQEELHAHVKTLETEYRDRGLFIYNIARKLRISVGTTQKILAAALLRSNKITARFMASWDRSPHFSPLIRSTWARSTTC